jgi:hypothetical protein
VNHPLHQAPDDTVAWAERARAIRAPALTQDDFLTPTWHRIRALLAERLQEYRELNDSGDADITAKRRGRIAELKDLLALDPKAQLESRRPPSARRQFFDQPTQEP